MMRVLHTIGLYCLFVRKVFAKPEKKRMYYYETLKEVEKLGINSMWIIAIISFFMGAIITIQTAYGTESPFIPMYLTGLAARESILLEFSSAVVALILAGKVGSSIASEIGSMRVTEQIDALEMMGVNSASYLVLPKVLAALIFNPFLCIISIIVGIFGGWSVGTLTGAITSQSYIQGIQYDFNPFYIVFALIKTLVFAFILTTVSAFYGYHVRGGSLEVGRSSTQAVVHSSVLVILFNLLLTHLFMS